MPATLRWLAIHTSTPASTRARAMSGLHVGKADRQVGREREDAVDLRARERRDARLLVTRLGRAHGEAGDADDAVLLAERVEHLGRLFGEADDAARADGGHAPKYPRSTTADERCAR
jgi:hypothetical protein